MTAPASAAARVAAAAHDLLGTPYTVIREIGAGGMGVVVEATDDRTGAQCAVKVIRADGPPDLVERFRLEAETLSKGRSPHFVRVLDVGRGAGGAPYYAMELLVGRTAGELVRAQGPLPLEDVLALGIQLFDGLAAAHALGVVHRDVKPDNLFLVGEGRPAFLKLLDFGIAKVTEATQDGPQPLAVPTAEGLMIGTLRWAAPEVVLASGVDARADLYSAGLVLWSLATGRLVFHHVKTREELLLAQMRDPLPPVAAERAEPGFASLDGLISRLTKKAKEERLATASDAASWLRTLLRTEFDRALPPVAPGGVPRLESAGARPNAPTAAAAAGVVPAAARPAGGGPALVTFPQLSPGQRFEGRYQIESHLGKGGMGTVYRAKQTFLSREVAIKLIPLEARSVNVDLREQFANEMQVLARLDHPNIVKIFDGGVTEDNMAYIVMELLPGSALRMGLQGGVPIKNLACCLYLTQVANGLMALHSVPILHRDIKPENVMVLPSGEVKIVDFGLARVRTKSKYATRNPNPTGTLHYMPKEQLLNEPLDESVDVFAFGLMLFECFTGQHPRATESGSFQNARETIVSVVEDKPIVPLRWLRPDLPEELLELAERCVALDPSSRPKPKEIVEVLVSVGQWAKTHREPSPGATPPPPEPSTASPAPEVTRTEPLPPVERPRGADPERFGKRGTVRMAPPAQAPTADADPTDRMLAPALTFARTPERAVAAVVADSPQPLGRDAPTARAPAARARRLVALVLVGIFTLAAILVGVELSVPGAIIGSRRAAASASGSVAPVTRAAPSMSSEREPAPPAASAPPTAPPIGTPDPIPSVTSGTPNVPTTARPTPRIIAPTPTPHAASATPSPSTSNAPKWRPAWQ